MSVMLNLAYQGQIHSVMMAPNQRLAYALEQVCQVFSLDKDQYVLVSKRKILDLSLACPLLGLVSGSNINVIQNDRLQIHSSGNPINKNKILVSVAVQLQDQLIKLKCPSSTTLWDLLLKVEHQAKVCLLEASSSSTTLISSTTGQSTSSEDIVYYAQPCLQFMTTRISTNRELRRETISSLGIHNGSIFLRFSQLPTSIPLETFLDKDRIDRVMEDEEMDHERKMRHGDEERVARAREESEKKVARWMKEEEVKQLPNSPQCDLLLMSKDSTLNSDHDRDGKIREDKVIIPSHLIQGGITDVTLSKFHETLRHLTSSSSNQEGGPLEKIKCNEEGEDRVGEFPVDFDRQTVIFFSSSLRSQSDSHLSSNSFSSKTVNHNHSSRSSILGIVWDDLPDEFFDLTQDELKAMAFKKHKVEGFQTAEMRKEAMARKNKQSDLKGKSCTIRIRLPPDGDIQVQGQFYPEEKVVSIQIWMQNLLHDPKQPFELYLTPPKVKLDMTKTLREHDIFRNAIVMLRWIGPPREKYLQYQYDHPLGNIDDESRKQDEARLAADKNRMDPLEISKDGSQTFSTCTKQKPISPSTTSSPSIEDGGQKCKAAKSSSFRGVPKWFTAGLKKK